MLFKHLLNKLDTSLPAYDKLKHYYTGEIIATLMLLVYFFVYKKWWLIPLVGLMIGLVKEYVLDRKFGGFVEFKDALYTALPSIRTALLLLYIEQQ